MSNEIKEWGNNNRQGFLDWVYKTFNHEKRADKKTAFGELFPHQVFVRNFMQYESPYRGLLLFHGLGSGKTASSIAAAEGFINKNKKIIVMLPASLEINYRDEIMKHASTGNPTKRLWSFIEIKKVATKQVDAAVALDISSAFLKKNPKIWFPFSEGLPPDSIIRKDVAWVDLNDIERKLATNSLKEIINNNYHFIRYNGLSQSIIAKYTKDFFNDSFVIIDEVHNFISQVVNGSKFARNLYTKIMDATNIKLVLLSGTPIINHPFELSITLNLVRGYMNVYEFSLLKDAELPSHQELTDIIKDSKYAKYIDQYFMLNSEKKIMVTLLPEKYIDDGDGIVKFDEDNEETSDKIINKLYQEINKTVKVSKRTPIKEMFALPNNREQFNQLFLDETDRENPAVRHIDLFKRRIIGTTSFVKSLGEEYYPTILPKLIEAVALSDHQFSKYLIVRDEERMMERRSRMNKGGLMAKKTSVYRAFSRMACNFVFPNNIDRPYPKDLRKMLQNEIDRNEDDEDDEGEEIIVKGKINKVKLKKDYEDIMKNALKRLGQDKNLLSAENLRTLYSPKFAKIIEKIIESQGKSLVYSQFRSIEGVGVLRLSLIANGFIEVQVEKKSKENDTVIWKIINEEEVLDPKYDNKRFIVFDTDREKANVLLQLYNGIYNNIDTEIVLRANLRGEMFKTFMITQSGAEGISLKNVRTVLITEPFWNSVRIDQVIGRAARAGSHIDLPKDEQNISVYIFVATFTKKQLKDNFSLRSLDNELTSDAHILQIAQKKDEIIQTFLNNTKTASVDCRTNAYLNKLDLSKGLSCYSFPVPIQADDYAYLPDINIDQKPNTKRIIRQRKIRGKVITENRKKYVIVDDYPDKRFNYTLYKDAGILQEDL